MLKSLATWTARSRPFSGFVGLLERADREEPDLLRVLTYHRVERRDADPPPYPRVTITPEAFADQMEYLARTWHVVAVEELLSALRKGNRQGLPPRSVMLTFDDGYRDFSKNAWPILRSLRLPVALFVPTAFPGQPDRTFWWDRLHHALTSTGRRGELESPVGRLRLSTAPEREEAFSRLRGYVKSLSHAEAMPWVEGICRELEVGAPAPAVLSWDELRSLAAEGVTLGSHSRTHALMNRIPIDEVRAEAAGSLRDLEREIGPILPILAYPGGAFNDAVVQVLEEEGYALSFTTVRGVNHLGTVHPLKLRRIHVGRRTSLPLLRLQLTARSRWLNRLHPL